jgi:hypothetical protein
MAASARSRSSRAPRLPEAVATAPPYEPALPRERNSEPIGVVGPLEEPEDVLEQNLGGFVRGADAQEREGGFATRLEFLTRHLVLRACRGELSCRQSALMSSDLPES